MPRVIISDRPTYYDTPVQTSHARQKTDPRRLSGDCVAATQLQHDHYACFYADSCLALAYHPCGAGLGSECATWGGAPRAGQPGPEQFCSRRVGHETVSNVQQRGSRGACTDGVLSHHIGRPASSARDVYPPLPAQHYGYPPQPALPALPPGFLSQASCWCPPVEGDQRPYRPAGLPLPPGPLRGPPFQLPPGYCLRSRQRRPPEPRLRSWQQRSSPMQPHLANETVSAALAGDVSVTAAPIPLPSPLPLQSNTGPPTPIVPRRGGPALLSRSRYRNACLPPSDPDRVFRSRELGETRGRTVPSSLEVGRGASGSPRAPSDVPAGAPPFGGGRLVLPWRLDVSDQGRRPESSPETPPSKRLRVSGRANIGHRSLHPARQRPTSRPLPAPNPNKHPSRVGLLF